MELLLIVLWVVGGILTILVLFVAFVLIWMLRLVRKLLKDIAYEWQTVDDLCEKGHSKAECGDFLPFLAEEEEVEVRPCQNLHAIHIEEANERGFSAMTLSLYEFRRIRRGSGGRRWQPRLVLNTIWGTQVA